jgi:D-aminopeptidase
VRSRHGAETVRTRPELPSDALSPLFQAVLEATEEAVANALLRAETMTGNGMTIEALPLEPVRRLVTSRPALPPRTPPARPHP